jgi:hypothetical protein
MRPELKGEGIDRASQEESRQRGFKSASEKAQRHTKTCFVGAKGVESRVVDEIRT